MPVTPGPNIISVHTRVTLPARLATDNGLDKEITLEMGKPGPNQTWFVRPTEKPDVYIITAGASPPLPGIPGFQRDADNGPQDVVNGQPPGEWLFVPVEGLDLVFEVHTLNSLIGGVEELLGTEGDKVAIQTFPTGSSDEKPAWNFTPALE